MRATATPTGYLPFFVYGTLLPGQPNAFLWGEAIVSQEVGWLANGRLYDLGSFPILLEEGADSVQGMVIGVAQEQYAEVMARLDELEGYDPEQPDKAGYRRAEREVVLENGRWQTAWVYIGQGIKTNGLTSVPGGNWVSYITNRLSQIESWWQDTFSIAHLFDQ
jgi:gamma-glutamylcyclotransferase (GGCT)/AIG2-like uncharacterized protein YtfP